MSTHASFPDLKGKVALVTGIGQTGSDGNVWGDEPRVWGNGAATARLLALNGVKVFGCDIDVVSATKTPSNGYKPSEVLSRSQRRM
jgi:NAD(P)-dependent dehydrogenase (short-subunit alcohol dehydrogenase family)